MVGLLNAADEVVSCRAVIGAGRRAKKRARDQVCPQPGDPEHHRELIKLIPATLVYAVGATQRWQSPDPVAVAM